MLLFGGKAELLIFYLGINKAGHSEMAEPILLDVLYPPGNSSVIQKDQKYPYKEGGVKLHCK